MTQAPDTAWPDRVLADPAELADVLGVPATDGKLLFALRAASRRFRGATGWQISAVAGQTFRLDGDGTRTLLLPTGHVTAVTSVTVRGTPWAEDADYMWSEAGILTAIGCLWPRWYRSVAAVVDHGYDPVPEDVQEVVLDQAQAMFNAAPGVQQVTSGSESVSFGTAATVGVTAQWTAAVARYQIGQGDRA
ncbi:mobile element protein [Streptomyces tremellae]|uniref:Mobile element protein n=1 Tax=Streptomyces tremellae TaxID=1124239 RepID=A0ABP7F0Y5_9ACTN